MVDFMLFAQAPPNQNAMMIGWVIGVVFIVVVSGAIPLVVGIIRKQPVLGIVGGFFSAIAAFVLGCIGGLPVAAIFVGIIFAIGEPDSKRKERRRPKKYDEDDYDDDEDDRPRGRRNNRYDDDDYDDEDEDDRPRRRNKWDN
jgi:hypothetical protein